jgi:alkylation response protein AidB-like acyl-CoA dehydrogenase
MFFKRQAKSAVRPLQPVRSSLQLQTRLTGRQIVSVTSRRRCLLQSTSRVQSTVGDLVLPSVVRILDAGGASAVRDNINLHRHWRNARTVLAHNPLDYKRRAVGDREINGREPPRTNYF